MPEMTKWFKPVRFEQGDRKVQVTIGAYPSDDEAMGELVEEIGDAAQEVMNEFLAQEND